MTTRKVVDLADVREEREKRIDDLLNTLGDVWIVRIEKTRQPGGLKAKCECILACTYEHLRQNLSDVLDVMIALPSERDAETVDRENRRRAEGISALGMLPVEAKHQAGNNRTVHQSAVRECEGKVI